MSELQMCQCPTTTGGVVHKTDCFLAPPVYYTPDWRDAKIAALEAEVNRLKINWVETGCAAHGVTALAPFVALAKAAVGDIRRGVVHCKICGGTWVVGRSERTQHNNECPAAHPAIQWAVDDVAP